MNRVLYYFAFDVKLFSSLYWIPLVGYLITASLIMWNGFSDPYLSHAFIQGIAVPMSSLHLMILYSHLYDDGAKDTLIPLHKLKILIDISRYFVLHSLIISFFIIFVFYMSKGSFYDGMIITHLLLLFIFYQLVGLALVTLLESFELSVAAVATYTLIEVVTQGTFMPWPHIFIFLGPLYGMDIQIKLIFLVFGISLSIIQIIRTFFNWPK